MASKSVQHYSTWALGTGEAAQVGPDVAQPLELKF